MNNEAQGSLSGVSALMAQRLKYEEWIAALDARRATTPQHVFDRVRGDYERRLQAVLDQLATHRGELEIQAQTLAAQLENLKTEEQARRDERDELELRAHVGELSPEAYAAAVKQLDDTLGLLSGRQTSISTELDRTQQFLTAAKAPTPRAPSIVQPPPAPAPEPPRVQTQPAPVPRPVAPAPQPVPRPAPPPPAAPMAAAPPAPQQPAPNFDELAFLNSVVGPNARRQEPPSASVPSAPNSGDDLGIMREDAATLGDALLARVNKPAPDNIVRQEPTDALSGARGRAGSANSPLAANVTGNNPIVLRNSGSESSATHKTLKCAECGSMNYPTEWYCERCGAELASL